MEVLSKQLQQHGTQLVDSPHDQPQVALVVGAVCEVHKKAFIQFYNEGFPLQ
jgi:hypothetical protein